MTGTTAWKKPQTISQEASGTYAWVNLSQLLASDPLQNTTGAYVGASNHTYKVMRLLKAGAQSGTDKGTPTVSIDYTSPDSFGGAADLWGNTLTVADVEDATFGFALEYGQTPTGASISSRINAQNFGFDLPSNATVVGVETRVTYSAFAGGGGTTGIQLLELEMRLTFTYNPRALATGDSVSKAYVRGLTPVEQDKKFRAMIYDSDRNYLGEVTKYVRNEPSFKLAINQLHSAMTLQLAQNEQSTDTTVDTWVNETPEEIGTEGGEQILFDLAAAIGLGPGSNVEVNNEVDIKAYYGAFHDWVTESGEPIVTDDGEVIVFEDGAPLGRSIFTGYLSQWELAFGDDEAVTTNLLSHSKELDNIMLETDDVVAFTHGIDSIINGSIGIAGGGPSDWWRLAQVFRYTGATGSRGRIRLHGWPGWSSDIPISVGIYSGSNVNSPGALVASFSGFIPADPDNFRAATYIDLYFDPSTFANGSDYIMYIDTAYSKTGGNPTYPANFYFSSSNVANGTLYATTKTSGWIDQGVDLYFDIYTLGGATTRTFNSTDPSEILKQVLNFARLRGARVNYDNSTIEPTNTLVSITFKTNTISEAIAATLKTAPADWYYYYDPGTNMLHFHPRPSRPAHYYTRGRDVVKLKIKRTIEKLINDVYFTGGGSPTPLFIRKTDQTRINSWRRALAKGSDNRVTVQSTAELLAQADIDQWGDPSYAGDLTVVRVDQFRIEEVTVGELSGFINFGSMVDALALQNLSLTYHPDHLDIQLDLLTPAVPKRIEDIKRNLDELEHANDPTTPTIT